MLQRFHFSHWAFITQKDILNSTIDHISKHFAETRNYAHYQNKELHDNNQKTISIQEVVTQVKPYKFATLYFMAEPLFSGGYNNFTN